MDQRIGRQGGWAGLVVILIALLVVAFLAKDALKEYGLVPGAAAPMKAGTPGERARSAAATGAEALDVGSAPTAPATPLERARGVEEMVKRQAEENARRVDDAAK